MTIVKDDLHGFMRTRHSLEEQTFHHWEHIIVPASSGDSTGLLAGELSLGRTVCHVQDGSGIYSAMNQGLALATQDFVVFLNAGDMLAGAETLTSVRSALTSEGSQWFVFGGSVVRGEDIVEVHPVRNPNPWLVGCGKANIMHPSVYYRRTFLAELGKFDESFHIAADLELNMRALARASPTVVDSPASVFFADGISSVRVFASLHEAFRARTMALGGAPRTVVASLAQYFYQFFRAVGSRAIAGVVGERRPGPALGRGRKCRLASLLLLIGKKV